LKTVPFTAAHTYIAHIWQCPPPPPGVTTTHGHLPTPSYKTFFPDDAGCGYLLSKASGSNYM